MTLDQAKGYIIANAVLVAPPVLKLEDGKKRVNSKMHVISSAGNQLIGISFRTLATARKWVATQSKETFFEMGEIQNKDLWIRSPLLYL